ncbi:MAG: cell division protein ZapD, partial [Gammaproteobacteria bacterium]
MNGDTAGPADDLASPAAIAVPAAGGEPLVFEQPLNERMRAFLRIDFLYNQAVFHTNSRSQWGSRAAVTSILDILSIITRIDARADVLKELERQALVMNEWL